MAGGGERLFDPWCVVVKHRCDVDVEYSKMVKTEKFSVVDAELSSRGVNLSKIRKEEEDCWPATIGSIE